MRYTSPMRFWRRLLLFVLLFLAVALAAFFWLRPDTAAFGTAVALCPGPDLYGYTCGSGAGFAYIDATHDTRLYQDDGTIPLELPFPFTFYGTTYTRVQASSNGNLQFDTSSGAPNNSCLANDPITVMGDMIAPFWDDLDLRFYGYLETEVVGEAPNRIFVIEWDNIPRYGSDDDRVTFAVQLFEESGNILFLYEDVTLFEGNNGGSATIGLQSAAQGLALQYSCNQPTVANATRILFPHPAQPNGDLGLATAVIPPGETAVQAKGVIAETAAALTAQGRAALPRLRAHWLSQQPQRQTAWAWADLTGNGRDDLIVSWRGPADQPALTELAVFTANGDGRYTPALSLAPSTRTRPVAELAIVAVQDLTGDGLPDGLLASDDGQSQVILAGNDDNTVQVRSLPQQCRGSMGVVDHAGKPAIVRDGCGTDARLFVQWNGRAFMPVNPRP